VPDDEEARRFLRWIKFRSFAEVYAYRVVSRGISLMEHTPSSANAAEIVEIVGVLGDAVLLRILDTGADSRRSARSVYLGDGR
jgi:hypothetical protein